jgi:hypothetical protein
MKITIDILELYTGILEIPRKKSGARFDEKAIISKALGYLNYKYFSTYSHKLLVTNPKIKYLIYSDECPSQIPYGYPSRVPDKIVFVVNPA